MIAGCAVAMQAKEVKFESGRTRTHLLELFTSEGCSSCPPAEAWFSKLKDEPGLWLDFVPVAFHITYWDHLGWRDPFASKLWTARQHAYAARWKSSSVYTPGFVLNGRELRQRAVPAAGKEDAGVLKVTADNDVVKASSAAAAPNAADRELHVARLGFGLNTNVKAGENRGRKLLHDFVVLSLATVPLNPDGTELRLPSSSAKTPVDSREAIAAVWVTAAGEAEPLQAVGGWLR
jgi:hypothetical protein